jgi:hypothetical protein
MKVILKSSFYLLLLAVVFSCAHPPIKAQTSKSNPATWQRILSLEGKDLNKLDDKTRQEIISFLESADPTERNIPPPYVGKGTPPFYPMPYFWKFETSTKSVRYVFVGTRGLVIIPGDSRAEAFVFDGVGKLLSYSEFSLGWRENVEEVSLIRTSSLNMPLIKIVTHYSDWGKDQYYTVVDDHLALIRLEGNGKPARNRFVATNWTKGPLMPERTPEEWEQALLSNNPGEILSTLMWIGGKHWDLKINYDRPSPIVKQNAELVTKVRAREGVQQRLQELSQSENKWIREAAELALTPHDGDTSFCCGSASK